MSEPGPSPLGYEPPTPPLRRRLSIAQFFIGLFAGLAISLAYYVGIGRSVAVFEQFHFGPYGALAFKTVTGVLLMCFPRTLSLGAGLLTSIAVAGLVLLSICAAMLSNF